ncbi:putative DNA-binding transcriptional regulator AlpA [Silvimonas terrae]|uniref:Putative DNA-binding transcriptional regulator AlpA n=1 Tax=Silvimonas terrae TaxID=300266 RepID=A0A840RAN5_9NEIS|nr:transcriptional regulator [Silvimonas terrae]MBB5189598.1 putative DNA-binding transcriptional regulator AlpA [Silvimonas terrae]
MNLNLLQQFDDLPDSALVSINTLSAYLERGVSTIWRDIKTDPAFPRPIRLSARCTRFSVGAVRIYLSQKAESSATGAA